ncbi:hypothetical protein ACLEJQ_11105 [Pseudomonas sp. SMV71]|uniref:hypothetical protein n=1 Tax=Pseudomonas sp. SMV71 TaxID=3390195 RepID=UPI003F82A3DC
MTICKQFSVERLFKIDFPEATAAWRFAKKHGEMDALRLEFYEDCPLANRYTAQVLRAGRAQSSIRRLDAGDKACSRNWESKAACCC